MDDEGLAIIREALDTQLRNEDFDRAVGRTVRRRNLDFKKYLQVMGELRELAQGDSVSVEEAARKLIVTS
jgi:hypothetical protein